MLFFVTIPNRNHYKPTGTKMPEPQCEILPDGTKEWRVNGILHRDDGGPAVVWADGDKFWYSNGELTREGAPAIIRADGTQKWYKNGELHREYGPAIVRDDGSEEYWRNGRRIINNDRVLSSPRRTRIKQRC